MTPPVRQERFTAQLRRLWPWLTPGVLIATLVLIVSQYDVRLFPPSLERESAEFATATTDVLVDYEAGSALMDVALDTSRLAARAGFLARVAASPALVARVGRVAGVPPSEIDASGPYNPNALRILREPTAERRAEQLAGEQTSYHLRFDVEPDQGVPIVHIYAQAPTVGEAQRLADGSAAALKSLVRRVRAQHPEAKVLGLRLRDLGPARAAIVNAGVDRQIAILVFAATLFAWCALVLAGSTLRRYLARRLPAAAPARQAVESANGHAAVRAERVPRPSR